MKLKFLTAFYKEFDLFLEHKDDAKNTGIFKFYFNNSYLHSKYDKETKTFYISHIFLEENFQNKGLLSNIINYITAKNTFTYLCFKHVCNSYLERYLKKNQFNKEDDFFNPYTPNYYKLLK